MADPKLLERFNTLGIQPQTLNGTQMAKVAKDESARWKAVVEKSGAKLD